MSVFVDAAVITQCGFLILVSFSVKPLTTENTENKATPKICKITEVWNLFWCIPSVPQNLHLENLIQLEKFNPFFYGK